MLIIKKYCYISCGKFSTIIRNICFILLMFIHNNSSRH